MALLANQDYRQFRVDVNLAGYYLLLPANPARVYASVYNSGGAQGELVLTPVIGAYVHVWQVVPQGEVVEIYRLRHGALVGQEIWYHSNGTGNFAVVVELTELPARGVVPTPGGRVCRNPVTGAIRSTANG